MVPPLTLGDCLPLVQISKTRPYRPPSGGAPDKRVRSTAGLGPQIYDWVCKELQIYVLILPHQFLVRAQGGGTSTGVGGWSGGLGGGSAADF